MDTLTKALGATLALLAGLLLLTLRTTPGLVLIVSGAAVTWAAHPVIGLALATAGALLYAEQCKRTPYTRCLFCHGIGYRPNSFLGRLLRGGSSARRCRACAGHGHRMRWGRAVMNAYRRATYTGRPQLPADPARTAVPAPRPEPPTYTDALREHLRRR